ncbi:MAG: M56 family metallopeptidase [Bacteroidales bacterium]|nr:M56 family metallopeptidase [Bacteroidales bacterium]
MEAFIIVQIKSACCMGLFCLSYLFLARNLTFYRLNRFYILATVIISIIIPVMSIQMPSAGQNGIYNMVLDTITVNAAPKETDAVLKASWTDVVKYIYLAVSLVFAGFLIYQLTGLVSIIRRHGIQRKNGMLWVFIPDNLPSFSFFNIIFISSSAFSNRRENTVVQHEMAHARQFHSLDIVFIELLKIIQWFNPFIYIMQRFLKETHEYLADKAVLEQNSDSAGYRLLLLSRVFGIQPGISNYFNHSLIKKRFTMMSKEKSPLLRQARYLLVIPVSLLLIFVFSCQNASSSLNQKGADEQSPALTETTNTITSEAVPDDDSVYVWVDEMPEFQGGGEENVKAYIQKNVIYPELAKKANVQGKVYVWFVVDESGKVVDVKVVRSAQIADDKKSVVVVSYKEKEPLTVKDAVRELDKEAIRVISSMPDWKPGIKNGNPVKVSYTFPINFVLQEKMPKDQ